MIKTAVIVAAGMGTRLGPRTETCPKGLLKIDGVSIIEQSIKKLIEIGIEKVFIGTGYMSQMYEELAAKYEVIECVFNPDYETTGSMDTLYCLKNHIQEDFILLESDLIYEKKALQSLVENSYQDIILASSFTDSGDEVFIEVNNHNQLSNMSKNRDHLQNIYAELIGITKISYPTFRKICQFAENNFSKHTRLDYEQALVGISQDTDILVQKLERIAWCEVDDESHWERAVHIIYPIIHSRDRIPFPVKRHILLNPGPATTTDTVKFAQIQTDICPREEEFGDVMAFIARELTKFVTASQNYTTILFGGSGTAAVESILSSVIDEKAVLIINNGAYGERMCQIAAAYQLNYIEYQSSQTEQIDLEKLEKFIKEDSLAISHLAIVHHETTTGLLNEIEEVGKLCEKYQIMMIVDAISSFAAIPIDMEKMKISYLAASSNKNLQGMAGASFVIANLIALEKTKTIKKRNFYLHLYSQYIHFLSSHQMRFTPPVQTLYALKQAIIETKWEGIQNRYRRYSRNWEILIAGITKIGLSHLIKKENHARLITAIIEPSHSNYHFEKMHDFFYKKGFTIYPGKLDNLHTFRVANIGEIDDKDMEVFIKLFAQYFTELI